MVLQPIGRKEKHDEGRWPYGKEMVVCGCTIVVNDIHSHLCFVWFRNEQPLK